MLASGYARCPMERYRKRLIVGAALMTVGFVAELVMLSGLFTADRPPVWVWSLVLLIGVGGVVLISAFRAAGRDRRDRTVALLAGGDGPQPRG